MVILPVHALAGTKLTEVLVFSHLLFGGTAQAHIVDCGGNVRVEPTTEGFILSRMQWYFGYFNVGGGLLSQIQTKVVVVGEQQVHLDWGIASQQRLYTVADRLLSIEAVVGYLGMHKPQLK
jgi:hypothetical protein